MTKRTPAEYDWTRALFNDRRLTKHFTSPRRSKIRTVTLHHMTIVVPGSGSNTTAALEGCYRTWQTRQASANYGVSGDQVWQYVSDNDAAWANASSSNHETLSIEHANSTGAPSWRVSEQTMKTGARLTGALHLLYGLGRPTRSTVRMHRDYYATACPGPFMVDQLGEYIIEAARVYDQMKAGKPVDVEPTPPAPPVVPVPPVEPAPLPPIEVPAEDAANWLQRLIEKLQALLGSLPTPDPEPAPGPTPEPAPVPPPPPPVAVWGQPDTFVLGATGPDVTRLGERVVIWSKALNLPTPYKVGPGPELGPADVAGVGAIQRAWGWSGADADGYPGPTTFARLAADPPKETPVPPKSSAPTKFPAPFSKMSHGSPYAAANTPLGLDDALARGYRSADIDIHVTKDKAPVAGHDTTPNDDGFIIPDNIRAKYGDRPNIEKMTAADLSTLRTGTVKFAGQYVRFRYHTLEEIIEWMGDNPKMSIAFEMKQSKAFEDPKTFADIGALANKYGVDRKRIMFMSIARDYNHLARFKAVKSAGFKTAILPHDQEKPSNWSQVQPYVDHQRGSWAK